MTDRAHAEALDRDDPLGHFRDRFVIAPGPVYMDGNSLGRPARSTVEAVEHAVRDEWGPGLVESWEQWIDLPQRTGRALEPLIGAPPGSVTIADSTTVNLYKLAVAAVAAFPNRTAIVTDRDNFPTDRYVFEGIAADRDLDLRLIDEVTPDALTEVIDTDVALVSFSHVSYRTAEIADMASINDIARAAGALTLWDLSHAVGSIPIELEEAGSDLAVGCTYKYLNGGPGAPAFLFVRPALQGALRPPIWGWFAHANQFAFEETFEPAAGINRYLGGTPPIISTTAALAGIEVVAEAGIDAIREKSIEATSYMIDLYDELLAPLGVGLASPRDPDRRGSHLAFTHPDGLAISRHLRSTGQVVVDFRAPDTIRMAVAPLYTTYTEIWEAVSALADTVSSRSYADDATGGLVT